MSDPVSVRQFAKLDGCSHTLVQKAIREGKLPVSADGRLDPALAGSGWRKQNRGGNSRGNTAKVATVVATPAPTARRRAKQPETASAVPQAVVYGAAGDDPDAEDIDFIAEVLAGRFVLTGDAERVNGNALAAKNLLAARKAAGDLVDIELAEAVLFEQARQFRDAWMNWPARVGPLIAAELGVPPDPVVGALNKHVQQQLQDLGEPEAEFADPSEG